MVELATLQAVSYIMGSLGVFVAAVYYVMNLREQRRNRRISQTNEMQRFFLNYENQKIWFELLNMEWSDYDDFERRYGSDYGLDNVAKRHLFWFNYDTLGNLLKDGYVDRDTIYNSSAMSVIFTWFKFKPIIEENRRRYSGLEAWKGFEYLANEMMRLSLLRDPSFKVPETFVKYVSDK